MLLSASANMSCLPSSLVISNSASITSDMETSFLLLSKYGGDQGVILAVDNLVFFKVILYDPGQVEQSQLLSFLHDLLHVQQAYSFTGDNADFIECLGVSVHVLVLSSDTATGASGGDPRPGSTCSRIQQHRLLCLKSRRQIPTGDHPCAGTWICSYGRC